MVRALENSAADPTYLEFFGLTRPPFARLSDPSQLFHTEQYSSLMEHLANAAKQTDSLVVICGAAGSGKTSQLNRYVKSLGETITSVTLDETCDASENFYSAFLTQIGFDDITGTAGELQNITREFLVHRGNAGDPVVIIVDNAHLLSPDALDELRWLSEIEVKRQRVISIVLAGTADLLQVVDAHTISKDQFRSDVRFHIRNYDEEETTRYVWHRLRLAGGNEGVKISNDAHPLIHRYSGGIPLLINQLCNDMLAEAHALQTRVITESLVRTVADNKRLLPHVIPLHGRGRRKTDPDFQLAPVEPESRDTITTIKTKKIDPAGEPVPASTEPDDDASKLLEHISRLSEQVEDLRADKSRALQDIDARNKDINDLRDKVDSQTAEVKTLSRALAENTEEVEQKNQALSSSSTALQKKEDILQKLVAELEKERREREAAQSELASATTSLEELSKLKQDQHAKVDALEADLKMADERALEIGVLERNAAALKNEIEKKAGELVPLRNELDSRDHALADLEHQLEESQKESETAQSRADALVKPKDLKKSKKAAKKLADKLAREASEKEAAQKELARASAEIEELHQLKLELQSKVSDLNSELETARQREDEFSALEQNAAALKDEIEKRTSELQARDQAIADLQEIVESSNAEREAARKRESELAALEENAAVLEEEIQKRTDELQARDQAIADLQELVEASNAEREAAQERESELAALEENAAALKEEMEKRTNELQARDQAIVDLQDLVETSNAEREAARERESELAALEQNAANLKEEIEKRTDELQARDQAIADLQDLVETSNAEREAAAAAEAAKQQAELLAHFERLFENVRAYETLRDSDAATHDNLVTTFKNLIADGQTEKQVNDALRTEQARLIERLLPQASDEAVIIYARLMVDQLNEFQTDGAEPCFRLLLPHSDNDTAPVYSESTRDLELAALDTTLRTHDPHRLLPEKKDVWGDLEPIFVELIGTYGEDNLAALQQSDTPDVDRNLLCNISNALYSDILKLPKDRAVNALRWILSP